MIPTKVSAVVVATMLVLTAVASVPVAAEESVAVSTAGATDVAYDSATLHGELTGLENASGATVWFEYWAEGDPANASVSENLTLSEVGSFEIDVGDLDSNTTYEAVAHAETANATGVGSAVTFTTDVEEDVDVETRDASDVTNDSATLEGEVTTLQGAENTTVWFEYWVAGDRANNSTTTALELDEPGAFSASVDGLDDETEYVYVSHATIENESDAGEAVNFTTKPDEVPLGVETGEASDVANHSATLEGELTGLGGDDDATVWFEYWEQGDPDGETLVGEVTLDEPGAFSATVDGLENDTTYVYVAYARTSDGEVAGDEVTFTTNDGTPTSVDDVPAWDGEGPFGQWLTSWLKNLLPQDSDVPFGQLVSELVHQNNPGSDHRSDGANAGGNGPPDHAKGQKDKADDASTEDEGDGDEDDS